MDGRSFERLVQRVAPGGWLVGVLELAGGVSTRVTVVEVEAPGGARQRLLVRAHGVNDLAQNANIARDEFRLLAHLHAAGLAVPQPYLADETGAVLPAPGIVMEFVAGATDFAPRDLPAYLAQLAGELARVHAVGIAGLDFLPDNTAALARTLAAPPAALDDSLDEGHIRAALASAVALLHGDYWPGNVLWAEGRLAAVIDWEDAALGDTLSDLGNTRLELLWAFGETAMADFTQQYLARSGLNPSSLPFWDLAAALRPAGRLGTWGLAAGDEARMRERHRHFVRKAIGQL